MGARMIAALNRPVSCPACHLRLRQTRRKCLQIVRRHVSPVQAGQLSPDQLDDVAKEILEADPEAAAQLKRYEAALTRVEKAQAAQEELKKLYQEAAEAAAANQTEQLLQKQKGVEIMAAAEEEAAKKRLQAAELEFKMAQAQRSTLVEAMVDDLERVESGKAGAAAMVGGILGSLPVLLSSSGSDSLLLGLATTAATCFLFGVTYRYALRQDTSDVHLRGGVVAAFGLSRALAGIEVMERAATAAGQNALSLEVVGPAALYAGQSMLAIAFAAAALEAGFQSKLVKRFGEISGL